VPRGGSACAVCASSCGRKAAATAKAIARVFSFGMAADPRAASNAALISGFARFFVAIDAPY
jgi:hypothetical protein